MGSYLQLGGDVGRLNDIWEFSVEKEIWRWVAGNNTQINLPAIYGTRKGIFSNANQIYGVAFHRAAGSFEDGKQSLVCIYWL